MDAHLDRRAVAHHAPGTMYFAANRYEMDDFAPYLYKTTDYGVTWKKIVTGIPATEFTRAIREDLVRPGLLYAATERSMYVSYDAGEHWQSLKLQPAARSRARHRAARRRHGDRHDGPRRSMPWKASRRCARPTRCNAAARQPTSTSRARRIATSGAVKAEYWLSQAGQTVTLELLDPHGKVLQKVDQHRHACPQVVARGGRGGGGGAAAGGGGAGDA